MNARQRVWMIGHGTRTADELLATLHEAGVETLVDVRRFPGSRRNPQFSQAALAAELESAGIAYLHSPDVGARRSGVPGEDRFACLRVSAFRSYAAWMSSDEWQHAIAEALDRANPCFMCAETLPWRCHRRLLADLLAAREVEVVHLLGPGVRVEQRPFRRPRSGTVGSPFAARSSRDRTTGPSRSRNVHSSPGERDRQLGHAYERRRHVGGRPRSELSPGSLGLAAAAC
jgi:hypothetical protein